MCQLSIKWSVPKGTKVFRCGLLLPEDQNKIFEVHIEYGTAATSRLRVCLAMMMCVSMKQSWLMNMYVLYTLR